VIAGAFLIADLLRKQSSRIYFDAVVTPAGFAGKVRVAC
jgi:hypothetical protein